jgi:hypothetical protein
MTRRELEEYIALRSTIRERGTARVWLFVAGLWAWAALLTATAALVSLPVATLLPLLVLAGVFEAVVALHAGVERIGRYIQVFYEDSMSERSWERTAMAFGRLYPGGAGDPLFAAFFWTATILNFIPAILAAPIASEWAVTGATHVLFLARVAAGRHQAAGQRALDLDRFQKLKREDGSTPERG